MIFTSSSIFYPAHIHVFIGGNDWIEDINIDSEKIPELNVSLNWECGEGCEGEYDSDDPEDSPMLRFDVYYEGELVDNGSQCTRLKATDNKNLLIEATKIILSKVEDCSFGGLSWAGGDFKRTMERLSWMGIDEYKGEIYGPNELLP